MAKQEPKTGPPAGSTAVELPKRGPIEQARKTVFALTERGELRLPENYAVGNALLEAYLAIQETTDKSGDPVLAVCTEVSVKNAVYAMVAQGLSPLKGQCYFIAYGKTLTCQRSTHGTEAVYKRICGPSSEVWAEVIYEGDEVEYVIERGQKMVTKHVQQFENIRPDKILGAYAIAEPEGKPARCAIMTIDQIRQAWKQGQTKGESPAHKGFPDEMAKKTVKWRVLKPIILSADDSALVRAVRQQDALIAEAEMDEEVAEMANAEVLEIEGTVGEEAAVEAQPVTEPEPAPAAQEKKAEPKAAEKGKPAGKEPEQPRLDGPGW